MCPTKYNEEIGTSCSLTEAFPPKPAPGSDEDKQCRELIHTVCHHEGNVPVQSAK
jgi:hypothetical protein